ncbi:MAG: hypothetical protein ACOYUZ_01830 [Patescibacteria group bacterium]
MINMDFINIFLLIIALAAFSLALAGKSIAPFFPMRIKDLKRIHEESDLKAGDSFYEIGCGDGRVCRYMAINNPEAQITGIEYAWPLYLFCRASNIIKPVKNLQIKFGNALKNDFTDAKVIYLYGMTKTLNQKIIPKLSREVGTGTKLISYVFSVDKWEGEQKTNKPEPTDLPIYIYYF